MANKDFKVKKGLVVTENILAQGNIQLVDSLGNTITLVDSSNNVVVAGSIIGPSTLTIDPAAIGDATGLVRILGNLQVEGTTTTINSTTVSINDKNLVLADSASNAAAADGAGITINGANATLTYASSGDKFVFNKNIEAAQFTGSVIGSVTGNIVGNVTGNITGTVSDISNHSTSNLSEGTNLYYTTTRSDSDFDASFALASTDSLSEGSTNLYHTTARVRSSISGDKGISYNSSTGVIDVDSTNITSIARGAVSASGALTYNAANGQFSFISGQSGLIDSSLAQGIIDSNLSNTINHNLILDSSKEFKILGGVSADSSKNVVLSSSTDNIYERYQAVAQGFSAGLGVYRDGSSSGYSFNAPAIRVLNSTELSKFTAAFTAGEKIYILKASAGGDLSQIENPNGITWDAGGTSGSNRIHITPSASFSSAYNNAVIYQRVAAADANLRIAANDDSASIIFAKDLEIKQDGQLGSSQKLTLNANTVELQHNSSKKFETTSGGATVTGTLTATGFSGDGSNLTNLPSGQGLLGNVVDDTTPQLGGNLDGNTKNITNVNKLGIGTTSVGADFSLHVEKSGENNVLITGNTSTLVSRLTLKNTDTASTAYNQIEFADAGGQSTSSITGYNTNQSNNYGDLAFSTRDAAGQPPAERIRIKSDGKVGIGTSTPSQALDVVGNIAVSGTVDGIDIAALNTTVGTKIANVVEDTTPQLGGNLDVNGNNINFSDNSKANFGAGNDLQIYHDGTNSYIEDAGTGDLIITTPASNILRVRSDDLMLNNAANNAHVLRARHANGVELYYNGTERLRTTNTGATVTGALGIGTASPNGMLELDGGTDTSVSIYISHNSNSSVGSLLGFHNGNDMRLWNYENGVFKFGNNNSEIMRFLANGNVGIGTQSPSSKLHVDGTITVTGNASIDGRDIANDGAKLDGIATGATANTITNPSNDRILTSTGGGNANAEADLQFDGTNLFIPAEIRHLGDPDTKLGFTTDTITITAGGVTAQTITATSTTIAGNLIVNGTTTTINSTTLDVDDLNITVAKGAANAVAANGAGLTVDGASATLLYQSTGDKWVFNKPLEATSFTGNVTGNADTATALANARTIAGQSFDGTANITIASTDLSNTSDITLNTATQTLTNKTLTSPDINTPDIDGGTIDGTNIGATTPGTGAFTTLTGNTVGGFSHLSAVGGGNTIDIVVTVASKTAAHRYNGTGSSLGYVLDGVQAPYLTLTPGRTYKFKQDDNSNSGHPFRFYYDAAKTTAYTTNVTTQGSGGSSGDYTQIAVDENTPPVLFYQCSAHGYMGNAVRTGTRNFTGLTTDNITEGSTNLYYTDARVDTRFDTRLATKSTTNLTEGTNLYFTDARADARVQAANLSDLNNVTGVPSAGQILSWNGSNWVPADDAGGLDSALTKQLIDSAHIGKINLGDLNNVSSTAPSSGEVLKWNGSAWAPAADATGGGGGGGSQNLFSTIAVAGQSDVVADATTDTLTLVAGSNMTITTNAGSDTITFASTGGGGGGSGGLDSALVTQLIDSSYVNARTVAGTDSSATIALIQSTVDSAYVQLRQTSGGGGSGGVDSAATINLIDSDYVQARMLGINSSKITEFKYLADSGQTVFSGNDVNGNALAISSTNHEVYLNGIRLLNDDFVANASANSITVSQGLDSADELVVVTQGSLTTNDRFVIGAGTQRFFFNADSGQTAFTGNDKHGNALTFDSGQVDVYLNGILLTNEDVIQNGTTNTITLASAADSDDDLAIIAYNATLASTFVAGSGTLSTFKYTLNAAQTQITGADLKGNTLAYVPGNQQVFLNGLLLEDSDDYVTTSTGIITLTTGANANDEIIIQDYASKFSGNTAGIINPEFKEFKYIADSGDTVFSGNDALGQALSLTDNNFEVFLNGIRLLKSDYVANTTANSITLQGFTAVDSDEIIINTIVGNVRFNGSQTVSQIVDSAYVNARVAAGTDSASVINLINSTVDEAYITRHSLDSSLALQLLLDSSEIIDLIDSAYVAARVGTVAQANTVYVDESEDDNTTYNVIFQNTAGTGNNYQSMQVDAGGLTFNPGTNTLFVASQIIASSTSSEPTGGLLTLQTADTTIEDGNNLGTIQFKASAEASGSDALTVAAEITAEADATFSATNNSTDLIFKLGTSGAATEKARLTHEGNLSATSFSGDGSGLTGISAIDSALTIQLIDSAYIQARQVDLVRDSGFISGIIDSDHINSRLGVFSVSPITTEFLYTVDSGDTVIFGNDDEGKSLVIDSNNFEVFLNGIRLQSTDYVDSAVSNRITLNNTLDSGDEISIVTTTQQNTLTGVGVLPGIVDSAYIQARLADLVPATNSFSTFRYVSTEGQSVYTGNDANGSALSYDSVGVQVFLNGLLLTKTQDFTLQNKNQITLQDSVNAGSELIINNHNTSFRGTQFTDVAAIIDSDYVQARQLPAVTYNATSSNITLVKGNAYIVDTSSARTLTLPASAVLGDEIKVIDGTGQAGTNNITINRNGHKIQGLTDNLVINVNRAAQGLVYYNAAQGWILSEN